VKAARNVAAPLGESNRLAHFYSNVKNRGLTATRELADKIIHEIESQVYAALTRSSLNNLDQVEASARITSSDPDLIQAVCVPGWCVVHGRIFHFVVPFVAVAKSVIRHHRHIGAAKQGPILCFCGMVWRLPIVKRWLPDKVVLGFSWQAPSLTFEAGPNRP